MPKQSSKKQKNAPTIPSGFPILDMLTGGYTRGNVIIVRGNVRPRIIRIFMEKQALNYSLSRNTCRRSTLLLSAGMDENRLAYSFVRNNTDVPLEEIFEGSLYVRTYEEKDGKETGELILRDIANDAALYEALIIDSVEEIIPGDRKRRSVVSQRLLDALLPLAAKGVPVIVTDYTGAWEASVSNGSRVTELFINEDVYGTVQVLFREGERNIVIDNLYQDSNRQAMELIRSTLEGRKLNGYYPQSNDELTTLVNAGAAVVEQIERILNNQSHVH